MENKCINCNMVKEEHKRKVEMCKICDEVKIKILNCSTKFEPNTREELEQEFKRIIKNYVYNSINRFGGYDATVCIELKELFYNVLKRIER